MLNIIFERFAQIPQKYEEITEYLDSKILIDEDIIYNVKLVIYELAGNILKHSKSKANMVMQCDGDIIKIMLTGSKEFRFDNICLPSCDCENGRGIFLVKSVAQSLEYINGGREVCVCLKCKNTK